MEATQPSVALSLQVEAEGVHLAELTQGVLAAVVAEPLVAVPLELVVSTSLAVPQEQVNLQPQLVAKVERVLLEAVASLSMVAEVERA